MLSDEFDHELIAHPVPNDLEAVKVLAASPAVPDLFIVAVVSMLHRKRHGVDTAGRRLRARESDWDDGTFPTASVPSDGRAMA